MNLSGTYAWVLKEAVNIHVNYASSNIDKSGFNWTVCCESQVETHKESATNLKSRRGNLGTANR